MGRESFEQYNRWANPEGGSAEFTVDLKHSLWSADAETWQERAPEVLFHLRAMYENTLYLTLAPNKEIRYGTVTITGSAECEDAPAELTAVGRFESHFDSGKVVARDFTIQADSVDALLAAVDKEEAILIRWESA